MIFVTTEKIDTHLSFSWIFGICCCCCCADKLADFGFSRTDVRIVWCGTWEDVDDDDEGGGSKPLRLKLDKSRGDFLWFLSREKKKETNLWGKRGIRLSKNALISKSIQSQQTCK